MAGSRPERESKFGRGVILSQTFSHADRIKSPLHFEEVFKSGSVAADQVLVIHVRWNHREYPRLGLSVSKRVGNSPTRNRWKRLIRESFRKQKDSFAFVDIVVRPKRDASPEYDAIFNSLPTLVARACRKLPPQKPSQRK